MPELPEVETVRRGLEKAMGGQRITSVEIRGRRSIRRESNESFIGGLTGRTIDAVLRHGKYLYVRLDNGVFWVTHLRMSGKLTMSKKDAPYEPHTHVVIGVAGPDELRFVDPRTFGEMFTSRSTSEDVLAMPVEFSKLGVDAFLGSIDATSLQALVGKRTIALKAFLLDQGAIAGIGSIYADEICFRSHLRPQRGVNTLKKRDFEALAVAITDVIGAAVALRGSSLRDASYRDVFGELGSYQAHHAVYGRVDEPCPVCGSLIHRIRVGGRSAHFCPKCQR